MLDILRRHVGWGIKVVLGIIIVTFVFFFGYTQLQQQGRDAIAIQVGPDEITYSEFRFFYNNQYENLRQSFKEGDIPDFILKSVETSTQRQLIQRELIKQFALQLGMQVTDAELADFIVKEKDFDPVAYKNFLNNFYNRNGFSYEELIRDDLLIQKFQDWAKKVEAQDEVQAAPTEWTFETLHLQGEEQKILAESIQKEWHAGKEVTPWLKRNNLKTDKVGPITLQKRAQLFQGLSLEEYESIFSLGKPKSAPLKPIVKNDRFLLVRLLNRKKPTKENKEEVLSSPGKLSLIETWFEDFAKKVKVESHIKPEEL